MDTRARFFTVKVWNDWIPRFGPLDHVELCMLMVRASSAETARQRAFEHEREFDGLESELHGAPVTVRTFGVDAVYDTGRYYLADFVDEPVVFSQLHQVDDEGDISFYERVEILRPAIVSLEPEDTAGLPDELTPVLEGERWFGVKFWRTWSVGDEEPQFLEEIVLAVQATSSDEAGRRATTLAVAADGDVVNDRGEVVHVRTVNRDYVFDTRNASLVILEDREVFGQLFELNPDGSVEFFDPDNDLRFREGAIDPR